MDPQGGMVSGRSLLSNPVIAQAIQQRGGMSGGQSPTPPQAQPGQVAPMNGQPPPPDPSTQERQIIVAALASHLKFLDTIASQAGQPSPQPQQIPPQQAQSQLLANSPMR